jgi:acetyltransferase-like isoleucine patch superfamily enzyme
LISFLLACLPSALHVPLRRMTGARIGRGARIRFGTLIFASDIHIGEGACLGPFAVMRARSLEIGAHTQIKPLTLLKAYEIRLGRYVHIAPTAVISAELTPTCRFIAGDHTRIFPFCWLEPGEGITLGNHVGIGGHSLIFTHGAWSDYLLGGPVSYGPVAIEDRVWLPWRVFVLANVTIGHDAIIGAGSVVTKSVPPNALSAGLPAKTINETAIRPIDAAERRRRAEHILAEYAERGVPGARARIVLDDPGSVERGGLLFAVNCELNPDEREALLARGVNMLDHPNLQLLIAQDEPYLDDFITFLRRYGIRVDRDHAQLARHAALEKARLPSQSPG